MNLDQAKKVPFPPHPRCTTRLGTDRWRHHDVWPSCLRLTHFSTPSHRHVYLKREYITTHSISVGTLQFTAKAMVGVRLSSVRLWFGLLLLGRGCPGSTHSTQIPARSGFEIYRRKTIYQKKSPPRCILRI